MFSTEFILTSLVVILLPGTGVIYTVSNGLFQGRRASCAAAVGCTMGIVPHLSAGILGLSAILHMSALAFQVVKYAGAVYLFILAWSMWQETGGIRFNVPASNNGFWRIVVRGILINILNPKLTIFFLAFLPQFISPADPSPMIEMFVLSLAFMLMTLIIFILYGLSANSIRKWFINSPESIAWLRRSFAAVFAALGIKLALTET